MSAYLSAISVRENSSRLLLNTFTANTMLWKFPKKNTTRLWMHKTLSEVITMGEKWYKEPPGLLEVDFRVKISTVAGLEDIEFKEYPTHSSIGRDDLSRPRQQVDIGKKRSENTNNCTWLVCETPKKTAWKMLSVLVLGWEVIPRFIRHPKMVWWATNPNQGPLFKCKEKQKKKL